MPAVPPDTPSSKKKRPAKKAASTKKSSAKKAASAKKSSAKKAATKTAAAKPNPTPRPAPEVGAPAPDFTLLADDGSEVSLQDFRGQRVVLYFYPKDNTPGCTTEACGFRDLHPDFEGLNAVVLGVSRDSVRSHAGFREKQNLPFRLLSDPSAETIAAYGSWGEKTFMGRTGMGILRTTVLIDEAGRVLKVYPKVKTKTHAEEVKADLEAL
jgi:peroxiredoxin Q/BCP